MRTDGPKHSAVPLDLEATPEIREEIEKGAQLASELMSTFEGAKLARAALASSLLWEYMVRADWRYRDLVLAAGELSKAARDEDSLVRTRQLQFIDRTEAFHRQIYGTLSVLMLFLSHSAPRRVTSHLPISSVQKFLSYLREQPGLMRCSGHFDQLLLSVKFRASFLDHPQQSKLHHWMTMGMPSETVIIYYVPSYVEPVKNSVASAPTGPIQHLNPREPDFRPIIDCSSFHVSPEPLKSLDALCSIILTVLEWCRGVDAKRHDTT